MPTIKTKWLPAPLAAAGKQVEEVPQNMFRIPSAEENIIMEMPQKIRI